MRFNGTLKTWNDDRGFGVIEPSQGGQALFVHIKAFEDRAVRPQIGQALSFEVASGPDGKKRAKRVLVVQTARLARPRRSNSAPAQWGTASLFAIPAFALLYLVVTLIWRVPYWVAGLYLVASVVCFLAYAADKSAAVAGRWRVSERTLIFMGLAGGWPGGILAQQVLRHKSNKAEFRAVFWASVVLNVVAFVGLNSPLLWRVMAPISKFSAL